MSERRSGRDDDRLFVRKGRRSYRRSFSRAEVRWGAVVLVALAAIAAWVAWKGAHPDLALFASGLDPTTPTGAAKGPAAAAGDHAPFPADLARDGWRAGAVTHFDSTNLYVKIDGREDYFKSFGFRQLHCVSLTAASDAAATVDIELFDLGTAANALGAYAGERPPEIVPRAEASGMWHRARNAEFATVGRYYARILGSDESPAVVAQLDRVRAALASALPAEPLPWGYALFVAGMKLDPSRVTYAPENAFSFGFGRQVYSAKLGDGDLEGFVVATADAPAATQLATRFSDGFREYGEDGGARNGLHWAKDRYLGTFATATATGNWVVGVRGAADPTRGATALGQLQRAVAALPPETAAQARAEAATAASAPATPPSASGATGEAEIGAPPKHD